MSGQLSGASEAIFQLLSVEIKTRRDMHICAVNLVFLPHLLGIIPFLCGILQPTLRVRCSIHKSTAEAIFTPPLLLLVGL